MNAAIALISMKEKRMHVGHDQVHGTWDAAARPAARISPGLPVELDVLDASGARLGPASTSADLKALDLAGLNPLTGPLYVTGARAGDGLLVHIREITTGGWGWCGIYPGDLLGDRFPDVYLVHATSGPAFVELPHLRVPTVPAVGSIGVAPADHGARAAVAVGRWGGNLGVRHLTAGSSVLLPVMVPGALLSLGAVNVAPGSSQMVGGGVQLAARVHLDVEIHPGAAPPAPVVHAPGLAHATGPMLITTGIGPDPRTAARAATMHMIRELTATRDLSVTDAYLVACLAADLTICQELADPAYVVAAQLPVQVLR